MLTEQLANRILEISRENIPPQAWKAAKQTFKDCYGCILAGAYEKASMIARDYAKLSPTMAVSSIIGAKGLKTCPEMAAMVNGVAAHIHDYDDVSTTITGHPSVVTVPTALAVGEMLKASGEQVLTAYITGVEVMALVARGVNPGHYSRGWHNTGTLGVFGAVATAGKLLGLNHKQLVHALGIAASRSGGLKGNFGTMTKSLHAGLAASNGIFAARMAQLGFESNLNIMEMEGGFAKVTSGDINQEAIDTFLKQGGSEFMMPGLAIKPYPSCKGTHNGIDAVLALRKHYGLRQEMVERILVDCQPIAKDLLKYKKAATPLEGKFSMNYCLACALHYGQVTMDNFEGSGIEDPVLLELMDKVHMEVDHSLAGGAYFNGTWETRVTVVLKDGRNLVRHVRYASGDPEHPLTEEQLGEKLWDCISKAMDTRNMKIFIPLLDQIDKLEDVNYLLTETERLLY